MKRKRPASDDAPKRSKFDYEAMKEGATSDDPATRKAMFIEYFERFQEFPSYLFDNEREIDSRLSDTMQDILQDPETPPALRSGVEALLGRLPARGL